MNLFARVLHELRERVYANLVEGIACPTCDQWCREYDRKVQSSQARALIAAYAKHGTEWFHGPSMKGVSQLGGAWARMAYWGLIEEELDVRPDGGRTGWWRLTPFAVAFILHGARIVESKFVYNGKVRSEGGPLVDIHHCLGDRFRLDELLASRAAAGPRTRRIKRR